MYIVIECDDSELYEKLKVDEVKLLLESVDWDYGNDVGSKLVVRKVYKVVVIDECE